MEGMLRSYIRFISVAPDTTPFRPVIVGGGADYLRGAEPEGIAVFRNSSYPLDRQN